jgi:zinc transporter, ZIP family
VRLAGRLPRRLWLLAVALGLVGAGAAIAYAGPWHDTASPAQDVRVARATLEQGAIVLVVVNNSTETARVAQIILNDAFVDFRQSATAVAPGASDRITVSYPWIAGESYDVSLLTATGATIDYGIEDAAAGTQQA